MKNENSFLFQTEKVVNLTFNCNQKANFNYLSVLIVFQFSLICVNKKNWRKTNVKPAQFDSRFANIDADDVSSEEATTSGQNKQPETNEANVDLSELRKEIVDEIKTQFDSCKCFNLICFFFVNKKKTLSFEKLKKTKRRKRANLNLNNQTFWFWSSKNA